MSDTLKYRLNKNGELETRGPYFFYQNHGKAIPIFRDQQKISFRCKGIDSEQVITIKKEQLENWYFKGKTKKTNLLEIGDFKFVFFTQEDNSFSGLFQ